MTTTVGTERTLESLLEDLIQLDYDAADAYQAAIDRLEDSSYRTRLAEFMRDHLRHITELGEILSSMGRTPPKEGDMKALLTKGKVVIAGLMGDDGDVMAVAKPLADEPGGDGLHAPDARCVPVAEQQDAHRRQLYDVGSRRAV